MLPVALVKARQALAELTGLPLEQIRQVRFEAVDWRDSCMGVVTPGVGCLEVITPGYRIVLEAGGAQYEYHTNQDGSRVVLAELGSGELTRIARLLAGRYLGAVDADPIEQARLATAYLHLAEASHLDQVEVFFFGQGAGDTAAPVAARGEQVWEEGDIGDDVADLQATAGAKDAICFVEDPAFVRSQVDDTVGDDHIHAGAVDGQGIRLTLAELDVGQPGGCGGAAGTLEHGGGHVDADDLALRADLAGGDEGIQTTTAADVDHDLTGLQSSKGGGIAAAEGEIGGLGGNRRRSAAE